MVTNWRNSAPLLCCWLLLAAACGDDPAVTPGARPASSLRVHFIDVGQGDATLLEFPCAAMLVDMGGESGGGFDSNKALRTYLDAFFARRTDLNRTLALVAITHPHIDHIRGITGVLLDSSMKLTLGRAITNGMDEGAGQKALHAALDKTPGALRRVVLGDVLKSKGEGLTGPTIDPIRCAEVDPVITALWGGIDSSPAGLKCPASAACRSNANDNSLVLRVDFGALSLLFTGDLEKQAMGDLLALYPGGLLDVDLYQAGHHGSGNGTTEALVAAMSPRAAVISAGPSTRQGDYTAWSYGHPNKQVVEMLAAGVSMTRQAVVMPVARMARSYVDLTVTKAVYATGRDGDVVLEADDSGLVRGITTSR